MTDAGQPFAAHAFGFAGRPRGWGWCQHWVIAQQAWLTKVPEESQEQAKVDFGMPEPDLLKLGQPTTSLKPMAYMHPGALLRFTPRQDGMKDMQCTPEIAREYSPHSLRSQRGARADKLQR